MTLNQLDTILNILGNLLTIFVLLGIDEVVTRIFDVRYSAPLTLKGKITLSNRQKHALDMLWRESQFLKTNAYDVQHGSYAHRNFDNPSSRHLIIDKEMSTGFEELTVLRIVKNNSNYGSNVVGFGPEAHKYINL